MTRTDHQAVAAATLAALGAPTPWWPQTASGRVISDAQGQPLLIIFPAAGRDQSALARVISRAINEAAGEPEAGVAAPLDPDHLDDLREETQHAARQMGRRVGGGR